MVACLGVCIDVCLAGGASGSSIARVVVATYVHLEFIGKVGQKAAHLTKVDCIAMTKENCVFSLRTVGMENEKITNNTTTTANLA